CRCGHSQNKPFCSGMHWYVEFRDPVPAPGAEPTLFEWAGGLPALTRMTRLLYEKHVPADDLLAPLFAALAPDYPQRAAAVLAEVFGGPAQDSPGAAPAGRGFTEDQRARWVTLACLAADEAGLPADHEFRAAFTSYLDWSSRVAAAQSADGAEASGPLPRWDWGPAGPPAETSPPASTPPPAQHPRPGQPPRPGQHRRPAAARGARPRPDRELRGTHQAAVPRSRPPVHDVRLRPVVLRRRPGPRRRHPRTPGERHHALRRRLAAGENRGVQALDRIRRPTVRSSPCSSWRVTRSAWTPGRSSGGARAASRGSPSGKWPGLRPWWRSTGDRAPVSRCPS